MAETENLPETIGRYELLTRLATGGMAELFLARERGLAGLERIVVIKRILPHLADQPSFVEMFLREARIVARLSHPNVVQIYELGQEAGTYHIAMEYIHGSTVRELLLLAQKEKKAVPYDVVVAVAEQACRGLHAAHELCDLDGKPLGLVHRDCSPHNLMCTTDGHVKLLDFGVAKSTGHSVEATYSGNLKGKFAYLSPEQCLHEPLDRRSDIFAMGIVMWEMCTMRRLFKRRTELDMMQAITGGDVPPPRRWKEDFPLPVQEVILKALATDRDDRFETAEQMREALVVAAEESGLSMAEGQVAKFLEETAGETLAERQLTVENACERELTIGERQRLLHLTGSTSSRSQSQAGSLTTEEHTAVERPSAGGSTRQTPEHEIRRLVEEDRRRRSGELVEGDTETAAVSEHELDDEESRRRTIALLTAVVTVVIGIGAAYALGVFDGDDVGDDSDNQGTEVVASDIDEGEPDEPTEPVVVSGEPLALGWPPTIDVELLQEEVEPLHRYLEEKTGRPVPFVVTTNYSELSRMLRNGEVAAAVLPPTLYVVTSEDQDDISFLAMKEFDGTASSDGYLLVRRDGEISEVAQLEGKSFCFVDRVSTSGHLLPRQYIRHQGFDPDEFVGHIHWSGDHFQGMRDLIDGKCDAAAVYSGAHSTASDYGIRTSQISLLAATGRLPQDVVAVSSRTSEEDQILLRDALIDFDPMEQFGLEHLGKNQQITGFSTRGDDDFDQLRGIVRQEGLKLDDL